ncbi:hypothetical protein HELRODRAFT_189163 [Helobdella robusta]|uniref:Pseudouridine synthase RsuA/RluA-like domain-containing protein n=1 Tax=Helobdella robusta TaxID=6412 RepID=T1FQQ6_HELRO|nr:hypothetical protein HELRODRAFT_189163 [Helobdella robusta]ESN96236.1 hypothetical protein HELRODRAFT_189163 [Helobdella robusta]
MVSLKKLICLPTAHHRACYSTLSARCMITITSSATNNASNDGIRRHVHFSPAPQPASSSRSGENLNDKSYLLECLLRNVLFKNEHCIAIAKPNGFPMQSIKYEENSDKKIDIRAENFFSMSTLKNDLKRYLNVPDLFEVFTQKREFGGIVLFCFQKDVQNLLSRYFKNAKINKLHISEYKVISVGKMTKQEGVDEMTIEQNQINNNVMSTLVRQPSKNKQKMHGNYTNLAVKFKVTQSSKVAFNCTLNNVTVWPTTTKWDALEMFFIHKMSAILGDHKYSSRIRNLLDKQVLVKPEQAHPEPQALPKEVCSLLKVPESDTSNILSHVFCTKLIIPKLFYDGNRTLTYNRMCNRKSLGPDFGTYAKENIHNTDEQTINCDQQKSLIIIEAALPTFFQETVNYFNLM